MGDEKKKNPRWYIDNKFNPAEELFEVYDSPKKIDDLYLPFPPGTFRKGIYLYQIEVSSTQDQAKGTAIERLLINN